MLKHILVLLCLLAACAPISADAPEPAQTSVHTTVTSTRTSAPIPSTTPQPTARPTTQPPNPPTTRPSFDSAPDKPDQPTLRPLPPKILLNLTHEYQKWNNCGPVSLGVVATYFGIARDQLQIAPEVKGGEFDKNVGPSEMRAYLQSLGLRAIVRVNGSREIVQRLLAAGFPVIAHQWLLKSNGELVGHYRVAQGYDVNAGVFIASDPFTPPRKAYTFDEFEQFWQPWNHRYIVAWRAEQEAAVRALLGAEFEEQKNLQSALSAATAGVRKNLSDPYAFFNLGDDRLAVGDAAGAIAAYEKSFALGLPAHFYWYNFGPLDAYERVGAFQRILDWSAPMLKEANNVEEIHFWRGKAWLGLGEKQNARDEFALAVQLNARYAEAKAMLAQAQ